MNHPICRSPDKSCRCNEMCRVSVRNFGTKEPKDSPFRDLMSFLRRRFITKEDLAFAYELRQEYGMSWEKIGRLCGIDPHKLERKVKARGG